LFFSQFILHQFDIPLPNIQAATPAEIVMANTLQAKSANTLGSEKIFCAEYSPKLMAVQKRNPSMKPYFNPLLKVTAPDHFMVVVIKKPNANEERSKAQMMSWSGGRLSWFKYSIEPAG
jgi:hypothetical protein